ACGVGRIVIELRRIAPLERAAEPHGGELRLLALHAAIAEEILPPGLRRRFQHDHLPLGREPDEDRVQPMDARRALVVRMAPQFAWRNRRLDAQRMGTPRPDAGAPPAHGPAVAVGEHVVLPAEIDRAYLGLSIRTSEGESGLGRRIEREHSTALRKLDHGRAPTESW